MASHAPVRHLRVGASFLGIDLGTSSVKAVVTDEAGSVLSQAAAPYPVTSPYPGWAETDTEAWWTAIVAAVSEATATDAGAIAGIGLSGQMHGLVPTDDRGFALRPAMTWADSRAVQQLDLYRVLPDHLRVRLANPLVPGMAGPMLAWLALHEPLTYRNTRWALQPKDWVRARLTGEIAAEPSDASATLLYDVVGDRWDVGTVEALGLDAGVLPPLLPHAGAHAGSLLRSAAIQLGLPPGIPVAAGAADSAAAVMGSGLVRDTDVQLTIGTGVQIMVPAPTADTAVDPDLVVTHLYRSVARRGWYRMAAVQSGGLALSWVIRVLGASWTDLYEAGSLVPSIDDPVFLPHLSGERTPYLDPDLRGAWIGLGLGHERSHLLRSALEGVAFTIAEALEHLPGADRAAHLRIAGGGSTSPAFRQLLADVLGRSLEAVHVPAASGRGAALLGACAAGRLDERTLPRVLTANSQPVADADADVSDLYAERRSMFRAALQTLRNTPQSTAQRSPAMPEPAPSPATAPWRHR